MFALLRGSRSTTRRLRYGKTELRSLCGKTGISTLILCSMSMQTFFISLSRGYWTSEVILEEKLPQALICLLRVMASVSTTPDMPLHPPMCFLDLATRWKSFFMEPGKNNGMQSNQWEIMQVVTNWKMLSSGTKMPKYPKTGKRHYSDFTKYFAGVRRSRKVAERLTSMVS